MRRAAVLDSINKHFDWSEGPVELEGTDRHFEGFHEGSPVPVSELEDTVKDDFKLYGRYKVDMYTHFPRNYIEDFLNHCESPHEDMPDASSFGAALQEMPPKLVRMLVGFARKQDYEMVHAVVNEILFQAKSESGQTEVLSKTLHKMLRELFPGWYERKENTLDHVLEVAIDEVERGDSKKWCKTPQTIDEAFYNCVWPGLELFYTGQAFSGQQLNKIMVVAAQNGFTDVLQESIRLGAEFYRIVEVPVTRLENGVILKTSQKPRRYSALHHLFYHHKGLDLEQLPWPEAGYKDVISFSHSSGNTLLHLVIADGKVEALKNVQFLMKHGANVNVRGKDDQTVLQRLLSVRGGWTDDKLDILLHLVEKADTIEPHSWKTEIPALHVLCQHGRHEHIPLFVNKGAEKRVLSNEKTLIDTLVLSLQMTFEMREKTMAALMDSPLNLGPFHADRVAKRTRRTACIPRSPVRELLLPTVYTQRSLQSNLRMIKMMVDGGAVSNRELLALQPCLAVAARINHHEAVDYLAPRIAAGRAVSFWLSSLA